MAHFTRRHFNALLAGGVGSALAAPHVARAQALDKVKFCWTNTVTVSAQLQHTLKNTDIAAKHGLQLEMIQFAGGPPINEALVSGAADIGSVADFSAVMLMAAGAPIKVVAHQSSFRSAVLATTKSGIDSLAGLKGKQVFGLFGITAYLNAQEAVRGAGLKVGSDMNFVNLGTPELADSVRAQKIDAFFMWDPWVTLFEQAGLAKVISQNTAPAMVLQARDEFVSKRPDVLKRFLRAHAEALFYASQNHDRTNKWFQSLEPAKSIPTEVIERASTFDPNWSAKNFADITTAVSPAGLASMQRMGEWGHGEKLLPRVPKVQDSVNLEIAKAVDAEAKTKPFDIAAVKITGGN
jgi:sulfonate transport system substrate-binding protein